MGNFAQLAASGFPPTPLSMKIVEASDPEAMNTAVNEAITAAAAAGLGLLDVALDGAGDGYPFAAQLLLLDTGAPILGAPVAVVYEAASAPELEIAANAALAVGAAMPNNLELSACAIAGAAKGHRWMGVMIFSAPR